MKIKRRMITFYAFLADGAAWHVERAMRCQRQKGLDPGDVKSELASIPWIIRALKYGGVVTKIESVVAARDHQGPMPTRNFGSDHCDTVEQQRELSRRQRFGR
jgi:hypothetical protein